MPPPHPWNQDSVSYRIWNDEEYANFYRSLVAWKDALEPKGPLKLEILEKIRKQFARDPFRWQREMEAEWAEDEDTYFSQALIASCVGPQLEYWKEEDLIEMPDKIP